MSEAARRRGALCQEKPVNNPSNCDGGGQKFSRSSFTFIHHILVMQQYQSFWRPDASDAAQWGMQCVRALHSVPAVLDRVANARCVDTKGEHGYGHDKASTARRSFTLFLLPAHRNPNPPIPARHRRTLPFVHSFAVWTLEERSI